jgi:hypothetical protein
METMSSGLDTPGRKKFLDRRKKPPFEIHIPEDQG